MSQVRFISDLHFGHKAVAQLRGFHDEFYHDENIVAQWNMIVHKKDLTYILGDVTMEKDDYSILDRLLGRKIVVLGNHDNKNHVRSLLNYVENVAGMLKYSSKQHGRFWVTHCPVHPNELNPDFHRFIKGNIHGHIHNGYKIDDHRYINVCAETIDYKPMTMDEIAYVFEYQKNKNKKK